MNPHEKTLKIHAFRIPQSFTTTSHNSPAPDADIPEVPAPVLQQAVGFACATGS